MKPSYKISFITKVKNLFFYDLLKIFVFIKLFLVIARAVLCVQTEDIRGLCRQQ